jgi:hypothetical protein
MTAVAVLDNYGSEAFTPLRASPGVIAAIKASKARTNLDGSD